MNDHDVTAVATVNERKDRRVAHITAALQKGGVAPEVLMLVA